MQHETICVVNAVIIALILNYGLSWFAVNNATNEQKMPNTSLFSRKQSLGVPIHTKM